MQSGESELPTSDSEDNGAPQPSSLGSLTSGGLAGPGGLFELQEQFQSLLAETQRIGTLLGTLTGAGRGSPAPTVLYASVPLDSAHATDLDSMSDRMSSGALSGFATGPTHPSTAAPTGRGTGTPTSMTSPPSAISSTPVLHTVQHGFSTTSSNRDSGLGTDGLAAPSPNIDVAEFGTAGSPAPSPDGIASGPGTDGWAAPSPTIDVVRFGTAGSQARAAPSPNDIASGRGTDGWTAPSHHFAASPDIASGRETDGLTAPSRQFAASPDIASGRGTDGLTAPSRQFAASPAPTTRQAMFDSLTPQRLASESPSLLEQTPASQVATGGGKASTGLKLTQQVVWPVWKETWHPRTRITANMNLHDERTDCNAYLEAVNRCIVQLWADEPDWQQVATLFRTHLDPETEERRRIDLLETDPSFKDLMRLGAHDTCFREQVRQFRARYDSADLVELRATVMRAKVKAQFVGGAQWDYASDDPHTWETNFEQLLSDLETVSSTARATLENEGTDGVHHVAALTFFGPIWLREVGLRRTWKGETGSSVVPATFKELITEWLNFAKVRFGFALREHQQQITQELLSLPFAAGRQRQRQLQAVSLENVQHPATGARDEKRCPICDGIGHSVHICPTIAALQQDDAFTQEKFEQLKTEGGPACEECGGWHYAMHHKLAICLPTAPPTTRQVGTSGELPGDASQAQQTQQQANAQGAKGAGRDATSVSDQICVSYLFRGTCGGEPGTETCKNGRKHLTTDQVSAEELARLSALNEKWAAARNERKVERAAQRQQQSQPQPNSDQELLKPPHQRIVRALLLETRALGGQEWKASQHRSDQDLLKAPLPIASTN